MLKCKIVPVSKHKLWRPFYISAALPCEKTLLCLLDRKLC